MSFHSIIFTSSSTNLVNLVMSFEATSPHTSFACHHPAVSVGDADSLASGKSWESGSRAAASVRHSDSLVSASSWGSGLRPSRIMFSMTFSRNGSKSWCASGNFFLKCPAILRAACSRLSSLANRSATSKADTDLQTQAETILFRDTFWVKAFRYKSLAWPRHNLSQEMTLWRIVTRNSHIETREVRPRMMAVKENWRTVPTPPCAKMASPRCRCVLVVENRWEIWETSTPDSVLSYFLKGKYVISIFTWKHGHSLHKSWCLLMSQSQPMRQITFCPIPFQNRRVIGDHQDCHTVG